VVCGAVSCVTVKSTAERRRRSFFAHGVWPVASLSGTPLFCCAHLERFIHTMFFVGLDDTDTLVSLGKLLVK